MKLETQVSNLELSKKLEELGVEQDSLWYWILGSGNETDYTLELGNLIRIEGELEKIDGVSAFTVAELGEMLPNAMTLTRRAVDGQWLYHNSDGESLYADTEANARAKCLIYLIENKVIEL